MLTFILIIIYIAFISLGLPDSILGSAWPVIRMDLQLPLSAAGVISMIVTGGTIISSLMSNRMIRRFGTGKVTLTSVFLTAAALLGFSLSGSLLALCLLAVPLGLGAGAVDAGLNNFVALHYEARHMNWLHCFWGIGATSGPVIMSLFLGKEQGWRTGYTAIAMIQFTLVAVLLLTLPLWKRVEGAPKTEEENEDPASEKKDLFALPGVKVTLAAFFCYCALELTAGLWGSSYLVAARGLSAGQAAKWISFFYLGITIGRLLSGFISMKLNTKNLIRLGEGIILLGVILFILPLPPAVCMAGFIMVGLGCAPIYPGMLHETPNMVGSRHSQAMMGIQMAFAYVGNTLMPPLFGLLATAFGTGIFPLYLLALLLIMIWCKERGNVSIFKGRAVL